MNLNNNFSNVKFKISNNYVLNKSNRVNLNSISNYTNYNTNYQYDEAKEEKIKEKRINQDNNKAMIEAIIKEKVDYIVNTTTSEVGNGPEKYRTWFFGEDRYGVDWCAIFINWIFNHNGDSKLFIEKESEQSGAGYSCRDSVAAGYGTWHESEYSDSSTTPQVGDVVTFINNGIGENPNADKYWSDHIGFVYRVDDEKIYTIEGNTGSSNADYSVVDFKEYDRMSGEINGYYRPNYGNMISN